MALVPFPGVRQAGDDPDPDDSGASGSKMSFLEHLDELRTRLIYICWSLLGGCIVAGVFIQRIVDFIMKPMYLLIQTPGSGGAKLIYTSGPEPFMLWIKIGFIAGIFIASPLILYQVWKFIAPGLYSHEKKFAIPFVLMSTIFFVLGGLFSHYVAFPWTWKWFNSWGTTYMIFMPKVDDAFDLYTKMLLGFGIMFEIPTLTLFLARMGVVSAGFLIRYFKYGILIISIVAAVASPGTDAMSMIIFAIPMVGLYVVSIVVAWIFGKKRKKPAADLA